jgi:glucosamine 6-phosphate synthetase-like amidotransferase/phosphosugar isomerase protein
MSGIFGLVRSAGARHPERASDAFVVLGMLAEDRGIDSAGVALLGTPRPIRVVTPTIQGDVTDGGCRLVKGPGPFSAVWRPDLLPDLDDAPVALGHARSATQGTPENLANAGPHFAGSLVGTHNGDVEAPELRARFGIRAATGSTDSEVIYQALSAGYDPLRVLSGLHGRAALAWVDRARPGRVHLARAALSPLGVAVDDEENVYWASNPGWFRTVERNTGVRFRSTVSINEGTYLTLEAGELRSTAFTPTARPGDLLSPDKVWLGFSAREREDDFARRRHVITEVCAA